MNASKETAQKRKELKWLLAFQAKCPDCPRSIPQQPEPPAPDMFFSETGLGIELTEYLLGQGRNGSHPHHLERVRQEIVSEAQSKYESQRSDCLQVSVIWATEECPAKREQKSIAESLERLVATRAGRGQKSWSIKWEEFKNPILEKFVNDVSITYLIGDKSQSCWSSSAGFWLWEAGKRVQVALDEKEPKVSQYRNYCQQVWLLIVAQRSWLSSRFFHDPPPQPILYSSFDRVFLLDEANSFVEEFSVEQKESKHP